MRFLHAGHADDVDRTAGLQHESKRRRSSHRDFRQSLPLHRLRRHRQGHAACGGAHARRRRNAMNLADSKDLAPGVAELAPPEEKIASRAKRTFGVSVSRLEDLALLTGTA